MRFFFSDNALPVSKKYLKLFLVVPFNYADFSSGGILF